MAAGTTITTGATVTAGAKSKDAAASTPLRSNPLDAIGAALQSFLHGIQAQYFNQAPKVTGVVGPTKNSDGTYTGQVVAQDADGDPLKYTVAAPYSGSTLTIDGDGNYHYTPDAEHVAAGEDYTEVVYATVQETNDGTHYHGVSEIVAKALDPVLKPILGPLYAAFGARYVGYFAGNYDTVQVPISITVKFGGTSTSSV